MAGAHVGLTVCEDIWLPGPPASSEAAAGAQLVVNISASPYHAGKGAEREQMLSERARENGCFVAFCGLVGGQDELLFDGHSCVIAPDGTTIARAAQFREEILLCEIDPARVGRRPSGRTDVTVLPAVDGPAACAGRGRWRPAVRGTRAARGRDLCRAQPGIA